MGEDVKEYKTQQLVVTRLPLFDEQSEVSGAVAFVLYDDLQPLTPLVSKYRRLHQDLQAARRALARQGRSTRYQLSDFAGATPAALEVKRRVRLAAGREVPVLLLEAEFFGVAPGAYTGADKRREGKFQLANGGTLFLDEVGDMLLALQAKLLRALQEQEVEPLSLIRWCWWMCGCWRPPAGI